MEQASKKVKCRITRADYPEDNSDIAAGLNGNTFLIQAGKEVELPVEVYNIFKNATRPVPVQEEGPDGQMRTRMIDAPRFAIIVDGVESGSDANARIAALAKEKAAAVDALNIEKAQLEEQIKSLESDAAATQSVHDENAELKKRIAELESGNAGQGDE